MAFATITFKNSFTNAVKQSPVGFSWTTFFFGCFVALFRADWKWFFIQLVLALITAGLSNFVFMFIYNKLYTKDLIRAGFKAASITGGDYTLANNKIGMDVPLLDQG
jgi:hypothetical protein